MKQNKIIGYNKCLYVVGLFDSKICKYRNPITDKLEHDVCLKENCIDYIQRIELPKWKDMNGKPLKSKISFIIYGFDLFEKVSIDERIKYIEKRKYEG